MADIIQLRTSLRMKSPPNPTIYLSIYLSIHPTCLISRLTGALVPVRHVEEQRVRQKADTSLKPLGSMLLLRERERADTYHLRPNMFLES